MPSAPSDRLRLAPVEVRSPDGFKVIPGDVLVALGEVAAVPPYPWRVPFGYVL